MTRDPAPAVLTLLVALLVASPGAGARELARGLPARFTLPPNYARSTDARDSFQITDGRRAESAWIWLDRRSVGWERQPGDIVALVIDLGRTARLDSIVVHSARFPPSGVLPPGIVCAVGDDATHLVLAGSRAAREMPAADSASAQRVQLAVPAGGARGRIVVVAALLQSEFLFVDEIEVRGEESDGGAGTASGGPGGRTFGLADLHRVCAAERRAWASGEALADVLDGSSVITPLADRAREETRRLAARSAVWRRASRGGIEVRRVDPWAPLTPWSPPHAAVTDTLHLWPDAWSAVAVDVTCADSLPHRIAVRTEPPAPGAPRATLRLVVPVESRPGSWAGDALPLARESLAVRSGEVRQLWVDVDASGAVPGAHRVAIQAGSERVAIPVRVHAIRPDARPLAALDWTYPEQFALPRADAAAAVRDNVEHGIDSWCLPAEAVPWPDPAGIGASGRLDRPPDFEECMRQVRLHRGGEARWLGWYFDFKPALEDPSRGRFRHPYLSREWRRAFTEWLDAWFTEFDARGIDRRRIYLQPFDETVASRAESFYRFLHATRPEVRLALTVTRKATPAELRRIGRYLDLVIVEREALPRHAAWIRAARRRGTEVWVYDVLEPSKLVDPTRGYRMLAWEAWGRGLSGAAFWSYGDTGTRSADAWDDFDGERSDYAVVYGSQGAPVPLGPESFAPSKRWQAFRIGMQESALLESALGKRPGLRDEILSAIEAPGFDPEVWRSKCIGILESGSDD